MRTLRPLLAEFIGVFFLVFAGVGAIVSNAVQENSVGLVGIALAHGLALAIAVTATMNVSGGHINPAVTIAALSLGRIDARKAGLYILSQLLGATAAAFAVKALFPEMASGMVRLGTPTLATDVTLAKGILVEAILTFFLAYAVMGTAVDGAAPKLGGLFIGLSVTMGILAGGNITGAAMNPARAFGPNLVGSMSDWTGHAAFWIGPILGAVLAAQVYERVMMKREV